MPTEPRSWFSPAPADEVGVDCDGVDIVAGEESREHSDGRGNSSVDPPVRNHLVQSFGGHQKRRSEGVGTPFDRSPNREEIALDDDFAWVFEDVMGELMRDREALVAWWE
ncbi:MAG TPA: hypothetical protein VFM54_10640 [Micromonosporaceae bacterium]|nr:hypothetical protein [Micromonosporaceae bacterium]